MAAPPDSRLVAPGSLPAQTHTPAVRFRVLAFSQCTTRSTQIPNCIHRWQRRDGIQSGTQLLDVYEVRGVRESRAFDTRILWAVDADARSGANYNRIADNAVPLRDVTTLPDALRAGSTTETDLLRASHKTS